MTLGVQYVKSLSQVTEYAPVPRCAADTIRSVPAIPRTLTGKKLEVPVRRLLMGVPLDRAANTSAMADPSSLDAFIDYARTQHDYTIPTEP